MNYIKRNNKITKAMRRMILLAVLGLSVLFSYQVLVLLEVDRFRPAYLEEVKQESRRESMSYISNNIYIDQETSLFAKIWMKDQYHQRGIKELK